MVTAIVLIEAERSAIATLGSALADVPGVAEAYSVTGEFDFVAMLRVRDHEQVADVVTTRLSQIPGIVRTRTHVAFKVYSKHDLEAMFSVGLQESR
ncbi:MAG TPA: Lrp/AsnC ligand binding domain-containing protein [Candidatus Dormibacteraeota bacterium]|nr:Lrp/AsnC ligand binding domain-containing protein [Candidatus Dormibacteraeota bacterium]